MTTPAAQSPVQAGRMTQGDIVKALIGMLLAMMTAFLSSTIVSTALPTIITSLHGTQDQYTWVVTATLLASTSSLTQALADRDQLIGDVITNLNAVLTTVDDNQENVDSIVDDLQQLVSGLAANSEPIAESVSRLNDSSANMSTLLADVRPSLREDIAQIDRVATLINDDEEYVENVINRLPSDFEKMGRLGVYGSFFQFYLCGVIVAITNPATGQPVYLPQFEQTTGRCSFPDE